MIDPGHGGAKPGAQGSRSQEKNITLSIAKKFGKLIEDNYPDVKVIYTRTTDVDISLAERARIANRNKADLFISIHANSHPTSVPNGVETFVMGLSESKANLEVAKKENADILLEADYKKNSDYSGFDPNSPESYVMLAMFQNAYLDKSLNFAQAIQTQYMRNFKTINRGVKQAELFVLYKTTCPSVLTEVGFISNHAEEAFMLSDEGQAKIAVSLFNAFMTYKATEEGTNKVANPKINLPGYKSTETKNEENPEPPAVTKEEPEKVQPVAEEPKPIVAEVIDEPQAVAEPKEEPRAVAPVNEKSQTEVAPKEEPKVTPSAKPTPTVELPRQAEKEKVEPEVKPEPVKTEPEVKAEQAVTPVPESKPQEAPQPEKLMPPVNTADAGATSYYTVQFMTVANLYRAGAKELEGITDFQTFRQGKAYAYTTGRFQTQQEAAEYSVYLRRTTSFKDAWAYLYKPPAASQKQQPAAASQTHAPAKSAAAVKGLVYRVQFCSSSKAMKAGDPELQGVKDIHSTQSGRYYIYTAGNYSTQREAEQRCNEMKKKTSFKDAFVIAIYNGERISLEQAATLQKKK